MIERYDYLTALRGWAAMAVVCMHMMFLPEPDLAVPPILAPYIASGGLGVPLFYLLSAFTLSLSATNRTGEPVKYFYMRRFFRIAPLFYLILAIYLFQFGWTSIGTILANVLFIFNLVPTNDTYESIVWAGWSISVEMLFYAVFPLIFAYTTNLSRAVRLLAGMLFLSWGLRYLGTNGFLAPIGIPAEISGKYAVFSIFTNLPFFAVGFVIFYAVQGLKSANIDRSSVGTTLLLVSALGLLCIPAATDSFMTSFVPLRYLSAVFFGTLVMGLMLRPSKALVNPISVYLGELSYSIYLTHCLVIWRLIPVYPKVYEAIPSPWVAFPICALLTMSLTGAVATVCYFMIEKPGMRFGSHLIAGMKRRHSASARDRLAGDLRTM